MPRKSTTAAPAKRRTPTKPYASLSHGRLTPQERLARLVDDAEAKGIKPMDEATLRKMGAVWPKDEDLDEFLTWLYEARRTGKYN